MLTKEDIISLLQAGEGYNAEFKNSIPSKVRELAAEVCAFANAAGGTVLLGVNDDNQITGIEINNRKFSALQDSLHQINPGLYCPFYLVEVDGKQVGVIEVPSGMQKPYALSGAIYIRQGPNSQKITSVEEMRSFFQHSGRIYFDEIGCQNFSFKDNFDHEFFKEFRIIAGFSPATGDEQIIRNLQLLTKDGNYKNGGVLFFGRHPEIFFDRAVIRCVAFEGTDKVQIIDDKIWGGPLMEQYRQAMQWLKSKLSVRYIIEGSGPRKEMWEIPETALKEAIINALAHRDYYDKGGRIMIELFDDRVEITNPGGLVSAITLQEFGSKSSSRNPLIFGLFQRINMVEQVGSGIKRMRNAMKEAQLTEPVFKTEGMFTVVFERMTAKNQKKEKTVDNFKNLFGVTAEEFRSIFGVNAKEFRSIFSENILLTAMLVYKNPTITAKDISEKIGVTKRSVENYLQKLKENKFIKRQGSDKTGSWGIIKKGR